MGLLFILPFLTIPADTIDQSRLLPQISDYFRDLDQEREDTDKGLMKAAILSSIVHSPELRNVTSFIFDCCQQIPLL